MNDENVVICPWSSCQQAANAGIKPIDDQSIDRFELNDDDLAETPEKTAARLAEYRSNSPSACLCAYRTSSCHLIGTTSSWFSLLSPATWPKEASPTSLCSGPGTMRHAGNAGSIPVAVWKKPAIASWNISKQTAGLGRTSTWIR